MEREREGKEGVRKNERGGKGKGKGRVPGQPGQPLPECPHSGFFGAKDDGADGDNWSYKKCKAPATRLTFMPPPVGGGIKR